MFGRSKLYRGAPGAAAGRWLTAATAARGACRAQQRQQPARGGDGYLVPTDSDFSKPGTLERQRLATSVVTPESNQMFILSSTTLCRRKSSLLLQVLLYCRSSTPQHSEC